MRIVFLPDENPAAGPRLPLINSAFLRCLLHRCEGGDAKAYTAAGVYTLSRAYRLRFFLGHSPVGATQ